MSEPRTGLWGRRPVRLAVVVAPLCLAWFAGQVIFGAFAPRSLDWILAAAAFVAPSLAFWQAGTNPSVPPEARRYWRTMTYGMVIAALSMTVRMVPVPVLADAVYGLGSAFFLWAQIRLPFPARSRSARRALWLDMIIVMACVAVLLMHFASRQDQPPGTVALLVFGSLAGAFLLVKLVLVGAETLSRGALRIFPLAAIFGGLGSAVGVALPVGSDANSLLLAMPLAGLAATAAAGRQVLDSVAGRGAGTSAVTRSYRVLPYAGIGFVFALLVVVTVRGEPDRLLVTVAAAVLTGLLVYRQLAAFRENDHLIDRLDAGLLDLRREEERFRLLVQNSSDIVSITSPAGLIEYVSGSLMRGLGRTPESALGIHIGTLIHPDDRPLVATSLASIEERPGESVTYQIRLGHADGSWRWFEIITSNLLHEPSVGGRVSNARDITETREVQDKLSFEATHDALTGLANRVLFGRRIERAVRTADPAGFSLVLIDLDDFKTVNDTLGHATGDALLVAVADRMRAGVRPGDTVARLGGDEFAIIFVGVAAAEVEAILNRIAEALLLPVRADGHFLSVRASFGVVEGHAGDDAGDLLRQADIAMYEAKHLGEGGFQRYQPGMETRGAERARFATALRTAIEEDQLRLYYQPVVSLPDGRTVGVEALVRWQHPERGLLGPGEFVARAEENGLIVPLGSWVLREAVRQQAAWIAAHSDAAPGGVSVNVSARQLQDPALASEVAAVLAAHALPGHRLTVEITESMAVGGGATSDNLTALRELGVRLSLDDFGTGASTLSLLDDCPVDQVKLDRSFVPAGGRDAIARAVLQLAVAFGIEAVAEGVETPEQASALHALGYTRAQGFLFSRPVPPEQICAPAYDRV